ncbi:hypothetical protein QA601_01700 [Chitinispirillales bacterium ANBcel5]|uniref:trehalose 6-phosphate synthase n=1 Tax=Cellulosispirillum alkaliphilum TaxID=3039283 RepID=UPI002A5067C2|nr:hypothetical protein [Chitinispirillales bacterium ANBcel5]
MQITIDQFLSLMRDTIEPRRTIVKAMIENYKPDESAIQKLNDISQTLNTIPIIDNHRVLLIENKQVYTDLGYEVEEIRRDLNFLKHGEEALFKSFSESNPRFDLEVKQGVDYLKDHQIDCFISDRDGTVNNYCGRYLSSIQSTYNALFLSHYAKTVKYPILLTAAPLENVGLRDISVNPENLFIYAGSKGRELRDKFGKKSSLSIPKSKQRFLDQLNIELKSILQNPQYKVFGYIGSGLQLKFGQSTIARQDIYSSVSSQKSSDFKNIIEDIVRKIDPSENNLIIEDTGMDIEIILTVDGNSEAKEFDKGDGVKFIAEKLNLLNSSKNILVCGDTRSDIPMIKTCLSTFPSTKAIFVTEDEKLIKEVKGVYSDTLILSTPDTLITTLKETARGK